MASELETPIYNFKVHKSEANDLGDKEQWVVELPHQCDEWLITASKYPQDEDYSFWEASETKTKAIEMMEVFVKEAQDALRFLKQME